MREELFLKRECGLSVFGPRLRAGVEAGRQALLDLAFAPLLLVLSERRKRSGELQVCRIDHKEF